jgi:hypothetical protein
VARKVPLAELALIPLKDCEEQNLVPNTLQERRVATDWQGALLAP